MIRFLKNLLTKSGSKDHDVMKKYLIVGLGNIGSEYENTRHNIGFKVLDHLAKKEDLSFQSNKLGAITQYKFKGRTLVLLKPSTYMNLSGKAVRYWMTKEKIPLENILIITDDINLSFGTIRLKTKGSDGGHNGLKDIQLQLGTQQYSRFRFGIGAEFSKGRQIEYVLGQWSPEEEAKLEERIERARELVNSFATAGVQITMNTFNNT
ncbi:peptidyl-tRNA hydrolase [Galbibacter marinus]|uniref:Peptidyl-tRNA hydrolase n=1 Tax=Galbibacter marinus TaxID=555500 RepID=K2P211_9FLAO|nr:aminoacyl-tRNA hydrolase [Galbibacter marinus]EKF55088.1 peptidyl-tRNA hydrolase [Galbibacter marinus]